MGLWKEKGLELPKGVVTAASADLRVVPGLPTGFSQLDRLLGSGIPAAEITVVKDTTAGLSFAVAAARRLATRGGRAAFVDGDDSLCVESLSSAGVKLEETLWIRGPTGAKALLKVAEEVVASALFPLVVITSRHTSWGRYLPAWFRLRRLAHTSRVAVLVCGELSLPGIPALQVKARHVIWGNAGYAIPRAIELVVACRGREAVVQLALPLGPKTADVQAPQTFGEPHPAM